MEGWHQDGATGLAPDDGGAGAVAGKLARRTAGQALSFRYLDQP